MAEPHDPVSHSSSASGEVAHAVDDETVLVQCSRPGHRSLHKTFTFERVYGPAEGQAAVFADVCPLLTSLLDGYNVCIMAYGQTGSGKTYTMLGPQPPGAAQGDAGLIPRAAQELFRLMSEDPSERPRVQVSIVEVYNNDIFDLLAKDGCAATARLRREVLTTREGRTEVSSLTCLSVGSAGELVELVGAGLQLRARRATSVHADSSRSHLVVTVTLTAATSGDGTRASGARGPALREASFINRSLAALADVLGALAARRAHVPYRNSKLTHLLQDALGGDAKLLVIVCVSPGQEHVAETLQSLGFGVRARQGGRGRPAPRDPREERGCLWAASLPPVSCHDGTCDVHA
uniref:Kinesin family member 25 n=1 Tax=Myotis myotis TaxID=51298 RepID=A0A7J7WVJ1_MYOMY|nr:kinesin family member 25 [Myotis myotis]